MKINIAFVIGHLSHGGAEKQLYLLTKGLNKDEFNITIFCLSNNRIPWGDRIQGLNVNVIYIPRKSRFDITRVLRLAWRFHKLKPHIIVSSLHIGNVYSHLAMFFISSKARYIAQVRSKNDNMQFLNRFLNIKAFNSADAIITNSRLLIPFINRYFKQNKSKIISINNGIELDEITHKVNNRKRINISTSKSA